MLQDFEMEKQEFKKKMKDKEITFEKQMQKELENLKKLRDCTSKEIKELKSERERFEKENYEVVLRKKHREEEPRDDNGECKKHRETLSKFHKESKIEKDNKLRNKKVEYEDRDTRNTLLRIQDHDMIRIKKESDKVDKDDLVEIEDKEESSQIKKKVRDILRVNKSRQRKWKQPKIQR
uniref:protein CROWDED NUCLEI 1-like n=1 Tax=Erigeron canadensis TaxID=72917 RepID=UPI001CB930FB|nr:protein CROWDED NUCLEI 1-like [Erigeron canadensis]